MQKIPKMIFFLAFTIIPNLYSKPIIILICGLGALVMYWFSEKDNSSLKSNLFKSNNEIKELNTKTNKLEIENVISKFNYLYQNYSNIGSLYADDFIWKTDLLNQFSEREKIILDKEGLINLSEINNKINEFNRDNSKVSD